MLRTIRGWLFGVYLYPPYLLLLVFGVLKQEKTVTYGSRLVVNMIVNLVVSGWIGLTMVCFLLAAAVVAVSISG